MVAPAALEVGGASVLLRQDVRRQEVAGMDGLCAALTVRLACVRVVAGPAGVHPGGEAGGADPSASAEGEANLGRTKLGRIPPRWRMALAAMRDAGRVDWVAEGNR